MCRFKSWKRQKFWWAFSISIHLMCRFKLNFTDNIGAYAEFQYILCVGSRIYIESLYHSLELFQYILCVGSSCFYVEVKNSHIYFNTSYVSVQDHQDFVSHYPLLWFQYILCVGSSCLTSFTKRWTIYFNTSYVSVQVLPDDEIEKQELDFNTSYVSVQGINRYIFFCKILFQYILCVGSS